MVNSEDLRKSLAKWAIESEKMSHLKNTITLAQTEPGIPVAVNAFDADPLLLGVKNGVVDLRTGKKNPAEERLLITKQANVKLDPDANCPLWRQFIDKITGGDSDLAAYLQRCAGYFLTGLTNEQCLFFAFGLGANGKTVFCRTLETLMGEYAMTTPPETLMAKRDAGGASPDLARLRGARLVLASEPNANCELDEAVVKRLTGQDTVACRHLYCELFEYVPMYKLVLITNHKPNIHNYDHAIWRRIRLVPFDVTIPDDEQDRELIEKLEKELPGILNWAIEGVLAYQQQGLPSPKCVVDATAAYRTEMDVLGEWISEECIDDPKAETPVGELHTAYCAWCQAGHYHPLKKRAFGDQLEARRYKRDRTGSSRFHQGIALKETPDG